MSWPTIAEPTAPPVGSSATTTHLYELIQQRARAYPWAVALGGQQGLLWKTLTSRQVVELGDRLAEELRTEGIGEIGRFYAIGTATAAHDET